MKVLAFIVAATIFEAVGDATLRAGGGRYEGEKNKRVA